MQTKQKSTIRDILNRIEVLRLHWTKSSKMKKAIRVFQNKILKKSFIEKKFIRRFKKGEMDAKSSLVPKNSRPSKKIKKKLKRK